jgi:hypothetical protein
MLRIFSPEKIRRLQPGANPQSWVPEANMLTTRPPKPLYENACCRQFSSHEWYVILSVMIPATSSISSVPVTSVTVSVPSSSSSSSSTTTTHSTSVESIPAYAVQSPTEILSQLSKAGVLPTMSSSQVLSVLSALGADACHLDMEPESAHHTELLSQQQVWIHVHSVLSYGIIFWSNSVHSKYIFRIQKEPLELLLI